MRRLLVVGALGLVAAGSIAPSSVAKEGVVARLLTPLPRDAVPGTRVPVIWTLSVRDGGASRPFNAEAIFVRIGGIRSLVDYAGTQRPLGRYRAVVRVPSGGVRSVQFGLMGWSSFGPAPAYFPVRGRVFR